MEDRDTFISENMGLVNYVVKRFLNRGYEYDDIFQIGCLGLVKAVDRFDSSKNIKFSTYAVPMIVGEIKRFLRDDMPIHISRASKTNYQKLHYQIEALKKSQNLSFIEIANKLGYTIEEISTLYETNQVPRSLNEVIYTDKKDNRPIELQETVAWGYNVENQAIDKLYIQQFISSLGGVEGQVIKLRLQGKTQMEIANILSISQVSVSRILRRIGKKYKEENSTMSKKSEIIKLIKEGYNNKSIAEKLDTSRATIGSYRYLFNNNIRSKAKTLISQGKDYKSIARLLNIDCSLLLDICQVTRVVKEPKKKIDVKADSKKDNTMKSAIRNELKEKKEMDNKVNLVEPKKHILKATQFSGNVMDYIIHGDMVKIMPIEANEQFIGIAKDNISALIEELKELQEAL
jgi:RNA polymerase sporulation-specific sigma factor